MPTTSVNDMQTTDPLKTAAQKTAAIIGAGPAGLMAAERLASQGIRVDVYDAMPSVARKFLLAGIGGMNITHSEDYDTFVSRYREAAAPLRPMLDDFGPQALRDWIHELGIETFVGTSGRVFPKDMKAAPLLRAWLQRLRQQGVTFHPRHRWTGLNPTGNGLEWQFTHPDGTTSIRPDAVVLALGGASWPKLGSDGRWSPLLEQQGVSFEAFKATNCGFEIPWSDFMRERFAGTPVKHVHLSMTTLSGGTESKTGEFIVSDYGIEGSLVYALSAPLREVMLNNPAAARLTLDWLPHTGVEQVVAKLAQPRKGMSFSNVLRKKLNLPAITNALLKECCPELDLNDHKAVAQALKAMRLPAVTATRPLDEVISCAGGVCFDAVNNDLMLSAMPGVFVAGEMLDWEAPTGGYLLTACFATGRWAGNAAARFTLRR
ncbi:NAD(P)/FAD-dependent oxidoreductase [Thalassolituus sp. LLYu03]|uniref:NAD(P)/FAD-dependent oxidoreductase n=1 Tax=Thalassolituus sp. LLYu03 TaxID=3421656 RepID=UPI003D2709FC